jgi:tripartite-type tricarboxylate transporter receptor subunit TctC
MAKTLGYETTVRPGGSGKRRMGWIIAAAVTVAIGAVPGFSAAQNYPERPIRFIIQSPAGGTADLIGRVVAKHLSETLGQPVVADNRGGAAGTLSANITAKAAPDGHTLLVAGPPPLTISVHLRVGKLEYNPEKDFTHIALIGKVPLAISALNSFPTKTFKEFLAYVKARSGKIIEYSLNG